MTSSSLSVPIPPKRTARHKPARVRIGSDIRPIVDEVDIVVPFPPSVNGLFFNRAKGGRGKTDNYKEWLEEAGWRLQQQRPGRIAGHYELSLMFCRPDNRARDLSNLVKATEDLLVKHNVISDDSLAQKITLQWGHEDAGVRVIVKKWVGA